MNIKKKLPLVMMTAIMIQGTQSFAEIKLGDFGINSYVEGGANLTNGADRASSKFTEYKDLKNSLLLNLGIDADKDSYHINFTGSNVGLGDQSYSLSGGRYGLMNYKIIYDTNLHNYAFNTLSPYSGLGGTALTIDSTVTHSNTATWNLGYKYSQSRKTIGAEATYNPESAPYYITLGYHQLAQSGSRPFWGQSSVSGYVEIPEPIDYKTNNVSLGLGYRSDSWWIHMENLYSTFSNANSLMTFQDTGLGVSATAVYQNSTFNSFLTLPPNNTYLKSAVTATVKDLPFESHLNFRASVAKLTNSVDVKNTGTFSNKVGAVTTYYDNQPIQLSEPVFKGNLTYGGMNLALSSNPIHGLDTKVYYNFLKKWNESNEIAFSTLDLNGAVKAGSDGTTAFVNELFGYYKHNYGLDVGYKLPFKTKMDVSYEKLTLHRHPRPDAPGNSDDILSVGLKNKYLDMLTVKLGYKKLWRTQEASEYANAGTNGATSSTSQDPQYTWRFVRRYDATDKKQDTIRLGVDLEPIHNLELALEGSYKRNDYGAVVLGREIDFGKQVNADISYTMPKWFKVSVSGNYGEDNYKSNHFWMTRYNVSGASKSWPSTQDPTKGGTDYSAFPWSAEVSDTTWGGGASIDVPVMDKLEIGIGYAAQRAKGKVNFFGNIPTSAPPNDGATTNTTTQPPAFQNIDDFDSYQLQSITAKAKYQLMENLSIGVAYTYEKFDYQDCIMNGYQYYDALAKTYMAGVNNDYNYEGHTGVVTAKYSF